MLIGSSCACFEITSCRIFRNPGFSLKVSGVGGSCDATPIARLWLVGCDGRRDKTWLLPLAASLGKTYYITKQTWVGETEEWCRNRGLTMYGRPSSVDTERTCVNLEALRVLRMPILVASILSQINSQFAQEMSKKSKNWSRKIDPRLMTMWKTNGANDANNVNTRVLIMNDFADKQNNQVFTTYVHVQSFRNPLLQFLIPVNIWEMTPWYTCLNSLAAVLLRSFAITLEQNREHPNSAGL